MAIETFAQTGAPGFCKFVSQQAAFRVALWRNLAGEHPVGLKLEAVTTIKVNREHFRVVSLRYNTSSDLKQFNGITPRIEATCIDPHINTQELDDMLYFWQGENWAWVTARSLVVTTAGIRGMNSPFEPLLQSQLGFLSAWLLSDNKKIVDELHCDDVDLKVFYSTLHDRLTGALVKVQRSWTEFMGQMIPTD